MATRCVCCGMCEESEGSADFTTCDICGGACCYDCGNEINDDDDSGAWACLKCINGDWIEENDP